MVTSLRPQCDLEIESCNLEIDRCNLTLLPLTAESEPQALQRDPPNAPADLKSDTVAQKMVRNLLN